MGLLSIFQRKKQTAAKPAKTARGGRAARQAPLNNTANPTETAEAVREARARARRRLMGATVLLLVGVIGFPLLFETQPRPIPVDLPIEIPSRDGSSAASLRARHVNAAGTAAAAASAIEPESVSYDARPSAPVMPPPPSAGQVAPRKSALASLAAALTPSGAHANAAAPAPQASVATVARPASTPASRPATPPPHGAAATSPAPAPALAPVAHEEPRDAAKPAPRPSDASPDAARFVVQIGAFADDAKMREARGKVERLGLKTYTQSVDTPAGKRVRVRVGPYPTKAEADRAAAKAKSGGLSAAAVLAL